MRFQGWIGAAAFMIIGTAASAADCAGIQLRGSVDNAPADTVQAGQLESWLNSSEWTGGVKLDVEERGKDLALDVTLFPGQTTAAAAGRIAMLVGRVTVGDFERIVFVDGGRNQFYIDFPLLKNIGCRFVVGEASGGENPIALMRELFDGLRDMSGLRVAPPYTGALLGDTMIATTVNNEVFVPRWAMSAVK